MATQGQYVGETVFGAIAEDVTVGQIVYCKSEAPSVVGVTTGAWYVASADISTNPISDHQIGVALETATATPITSTQSGTQVTILLKGYYSPGKLGAGGFCNGNLQEGAAVYLMPSSVSGSDTRGSIDGLPPYSYGAATASLRVVGYSFDVAEPYIIRFEPSKTSTSHGATYRLGKFSGVVGEQTSNIVESRLYDDGDIFAVGYKDTSPSLLFTELLAGTWSISIDNLSYGDTSIKRYHKSTGAYLDSPIVIDKSNPAGFGQIKFNSGSAATPSISFQSDATSGLFLNANNNVVLATNGQSRISVDNAGIYLVGGNTRPYYGGSQITNKVLATDANGFIYGTTSFTGGGGATGATGAAGTSGSSGSSGTSGVSGSTGSSGSSGTSGIGGLRGIDGGNTLRWLISTTGAWSSPTFSYIKTDSATVSSITKVSINKTANGVDATSWLSGMYSLFTSGNTVYFYISTVTSPYVAPVTGIWTITSMVANSTYYDLGLSFVSGANSFIEGSEVAVSFVANGKNGATGSTAYYNPNYVQAGGGTRISLSASGSVQTIIGVTISTTGGPVRVVAYGDAENSAPGYWSSLQLYRGTTALGAVVNTEGSAGSENSPFCLDYIDNPSAGTYTYYLKANQVVGGTINYGEVSAPTINAQELTGPGSSGTSGSSGSSGTSGVNGTSGTSPLIAGVHAPCVITGGTVNTSMAAAGPGTGASFLSANRLFLQPFIPARTFTSASMSCEITATSSATNLYLRVYDDVNGAPTNFLFGGTFSATTTGVKSFNYSYQFQSGRIYWIGCNSDGAATLRAIGSAASMIIQYGSATSYSAYTYTQTSTSTTISGAATLQNLGTILISFGVASVP